MSSAAERLLNKVNERGISGGFEILEAINSTIGKIPNLSDLRTRTSTFLVNMRERLREFDPQLTSELLMLVMEMIGQEDESVSYLIQRLESSRPLFVGYVSMILGWFGSKAAPAVPVLTQLVSEGIVGSRWAAEAIVRIGVSPSFLLAKLQEQLDRRDVQGFTGVLALIFETEQQDSRELIEIVIAASQDEDPLIRSELALFLRDLNSGDVSMFQPILVGLANDTDASVRRAASPDTDLWP